MKTTVILICVILNLGYGGMAGGQDLPDDILVDQYLLEVETALAKGNTQRAVQALEKIEALDTEPPAEVLFFYGKLLVEGKLLAKHSTAADGVRRGQALLKQFVRSVKKYSRHYTSTLKLLSVAEAKLEGAEPQRQAKLKEFRLRLPETLRKQMVHVQGSTFRMECTAEQDDCADNEKPVHQVQVSDFEIGKYEVTQEVWEAVMGENPSDFEGCSPCPVEHVSWNDVHAFLTKLNAVTGARYRLPTEAEWEYAARGGQRSRGYQYAGSETPGPVAWYRKNSWHATHPVGQKQPNELGLYDMSGNVWEWVADCWHEDYVSAPSDRSAWQSGDCSVRVLRGGSWDDGPWDLRFANRGRDTAGDRGSRVGVRLARTLTP